MTWLAMAWTYRNEIAIGLIVTILISFGLYYKHVLNDRESLKQQVVQIQKELTAVQKQIALNEDIANAIKKIRIQSNNYVSVLENSPRPSNGKPILFIPAGVPTTFSVYSSNSSGSIYSGNATSNVGPSK